MHLSPRALARATSRHPWRTLSIWIAAVVAFAALSAGLLGDALTTDAAFTNNPESRQAATLVEKLRGPERDTEVVIVSSSFLTVDDPAFAGFLQRLRSDLLGLGPEIVVAATTYAETGDPSLVSADRRTALVPVVLAKPDTEAPELIPDVMEVIDALGGTGFDVRIFGPAALNEDFNRVAEEDLRAGESVGILVGLIILAVVFGAIVAAVVPLIVGVAAIVAAIGLVALMGQAFDFSFFVTNVITMMGLAVGIDYSLFVVSRYRDERRDGQGKLDAIEAAAGTAGRAVFFSGLTVVVAMMGMFIIPFTIFRSIAAGSVFVVAAAVLASLTLLPALLSLLGDRIDKLPVRRRRRRRRGARRVARSAGFWDGVTRRVMRRPVVSLVAGAGLLIAAGSFTLDMRTGFAGVSTLPVDFRSKQAFEKLAADFPGGLSSPLEVVVAGDLGGIERLRAAIDGDGFFGPSKIETGDTGRLAVIVAPLKGDPASTAAVDAIQRVRTQYVPAADLDADVFVGGPTAQSKDFFDLTDRYTPIVLAFVLGLSFVLLTVAFRSIVIPVKAIILNVLSVGAAYGLIVLVSQHGVGAGVLGLQQVETIEAWLPLFLFTVLFGLSMDYHVFLLSRIREHFDRTGDNTGSVAYGLRTTARLITGAALIMVAVFSGFAAGRLVAFQQLGFGLAVAVLIDATLVRSVLVPASMKLLGDRNWYLPRWLQWLPAVRIDEATQPGEQARRAQEQPVAA